MFTKTKIAICLAIIVGVAPASFAKDQHSPRTRAQAAVDASGQHALAQTPVVRQGQCWVPTRDQNDDEYGADTRGLGHWGSCGEKGAVPSK
jgi:hypothetical protein